MKKTLLFIIAMTAFSLNAQNLFKEDFSSFTTGSQLSGQGVWSNNSSNSGGLGSAIPVAGNKKVIANSVTYLGYGTSNNSVEIKPESDGCGRGFANVTSGSLYVSFVLNLSNVQANNNSDFFRVSSGDNFFTSLRLYVTTAPGAFLLGVAKGQNGNQISTTALAYNLNQDHLIVIKYAIGTNNTSDDIVTVFIDPVFANGEPSVPTVSANIGVDQFNSTLGLDRLSLRQNWLNGMPTGKTSLISVSKDWAGLGFLPLANEQFTKSTFTINYGQANEGILDIKSSINLETAILNIYDIQGRIIENKTISLQENNNQITINPIATAGIYIVEIIAGDKKLAQKIAIQ